mgnify:CR=1 FL=1
MVALLTDFLQFFCLFSDNQIHWTLIAYTGSGRNQLTDDNVLLQTNQVILFTLDCGIGQNLCGFLEGCGRQEGISFNRRLDIPSNTGLKVAGTWPLSSALRLIFVISVREIWTPGFRCVSLPSSTNNLAKHLTNHNLNVLVTDFNTLTLINLLDFLQNVVLYLTYTGNL